MRTLTLILSLFAVSSLRAEPKEIAELFPADALAYAEINRPGEVGRELALFLKGSVLAKGSMAEGTTDASDAGILAAFLDPDMLKQAGRFNGVAVALTGFSKRGEPEFVAAILTGDSKRPGNVVRAFLAANPECRKVASVEGIDLYQAEIAQIEEDPLGAAVPIAVDQPRKVLHVGPVFAHAPGIVLRASSKELLAATIRRFKGKEKSDSLPSHQSFQRLVDRRSEAGILCFADAKALLGLLEARRKLHGDSESFAGLVFRKWLPSASIHSFVARLDIKSEAIAIRGSIGLDGKASGPLAEFLEGQSLSLPDLHVISKGTPLALTLQLPAGEGRLPRLLALLDSVVKSTGTLGPSAGELVRELDEKKILSTANLGKIDRITLLLPPIKSWTNGLPTMPTVLLHGETAEALEPIETALPAFLALLNDAKADAVTETIDGIKIKALESKATALGVPIHFGRHDRTLAIGTNGKFIAACLLADPVQSTVSQSAISAAIEAADKPAVVGIWDWADSMRPLFLEKKTSIDRQRPHLVTEWSKGPNFPITRFVTPNSPTGIPRELLDAFRGSPPIVATLGRQKTELRFALDQRFSKEVRVKAIDRGFEWYAQYSVRDGNRGDRGIDDLPDLLAPPPPLPPRIVPGGP